jgi:ABC-type branched-subunit amino acid transport system permease subunit
VIIVWILLNTLLSSPWGRILRSIREDEEVTQHHGHDVLTYKASSLALGAAIAALAGMFWAWQLRGFQPTFMSPATTTFLVWAAFIIGGSGNNKGVIVGSSIIILSQFIFRVLDTGQSSADLPLHETAVFIDGIFRWLVVDYFEVVLVSIGIMIFGILFNKHNISEIGLWGAFIFFIYGNLNSQYSVEESFMDINFDGSIDIIAEMAYVNVLLVGMVLLLSLKYNPKGLLPEIPNRPLRPDTDGDLS